MYAAVGLTGYTSLSGRRTFILRAAQKVSEVGGNLRDVQRLAGYASFEMTKGYVDDTQDVNGRLIELL